MTNSKFNAPSQPPKAEAQAIDASVKLPVLVLLACSILWLLTGSVLALIASIKLHSPGFLGDCEYLTYGRVLPAARTALVYGWGFNAAFAFAFWLLPRLGRSTLRGGGLLVVAAIFWNIGVKLGLLGIMAGYGTSIEWLELPRFVTPELLIAFALMAAWGVTAVETGGAGSLYVSQWYLIAALFWFPWIWSVAQLMLVFFPISGTVQAVIGAWYAQNLFGLWFGSIALAGIYYFIPKLLGKPIRFYYLAPLGFWSYAIATGFSGGSRLINSPVPAWVQSAGIFGEVLMLLPLGVIFLTVFKTLCGNGSIVRGSTVLKFIGFSAFAFVLTTLQGMGMAIRSWTQVTQFTLYTVGHDQAALFGVFGMAMFGAAYYYVPRLMLREWPYPTLVRLHFWLFIIGLVLLVGALSAGGVAQGLALETLKPAADGKTDVPVAMLEVLKQLSPWLSIASLGGIVMLAAHLAFAVNFFKMVLCPRLRAEAAIAPVPTELLRPLSDLQLSR